MDTKEYKLNVNDMSCDHCVGRITKALDIDAISDVNISLKDKEVRFTSSNIDSSGVIKQAKEAIAEAGFTPS